MEDFQKQETIENIKARVEALKKKAIPPAYTPGNQEVGSTVKIGETLYRVINQSGTLRREDVKEPSKIRKQRDVVAYLLSLKNPNLKHRLEREARMNKIKMFNKAQKDLEASMSRGRAFHARSAGKVAKEPVISEEGATPEVKKAPTIQVDPRYLQYLAIIEKQKIKKAKKRKASKLAEQKRRHNNKFNKN